VTGMYPLGVFTDLANAPVLAAAGGSYIEENVQQLLVPEEPAEVFAEKARLVEAAPLPVPAAACFLPATLKCVGPAVDNARIVRYATTTFARAAQLGISCVVFGSGKAREIPDGFSRTEAQRQVVALLRQLGPLAAAQGVTLVVEPIHRAECNFINSLAEAAELITASGQSAVRLLADFYHMGRDNEPAEEIVRYGNLISHCHVAELAQRTPPGTAGDDFRPFLRALRKIGYTGRISIEAKWNDLPGQIAAAVQTLQTQIQESTC